jgi:flavin-dependent dehydrogenase
MAVLQRDVVIVGGGPAGLSTALHLAAESPALAGRAVVLEKERYPRDKICAGAIGGRALRRLAALDVTVDVPMVPLDAFSVRMGGETITTREPGLGVVVRRFEFDHALAAATRARGLEVRDGCGVTAITAGDHGVTVETDTGDVYEARAIVGADGVGGIVRRAAGFPRGELRAQVVELDTEEIAGDPPRDTLAFDFGAADLHGYAWDFPTIVDGAPLVCRGVYVIRSPDRPDDARARTVDYLASRGLDAGRYRLKHYAERGFEPGAAISKPRVLLVGEAAGIDIGTGEGIAQAIEYGGVAAGFLARAFDRDDFGFSGWRRAVDLDHVGWQLRIRHACFRVFYGPRRPRIERMLRRLGPLFQVGARDFAGTPHSATDILRGGALLARALVREATGK